MSPRLSVVLPTHNPHAGRLQRTLSALAAQLLAPTLWELLVIDNGSVPPLNPEAVSAIAGRVSARLVHEPELGLSSARRRGFREARGEFIVLVDDDNVLAPDYLGDVLRIFDTHPRVGALGGRSLPEFETKPAPWAREFFPLLALRDPGAAPLIAAAFAAGESAARNYPDAAAPIGAGMGLRRAAAAAWLERFAITPISDRRGDELSSGGDNDIVLTLLDAGWHVGYFPELSLTHLIPASRLTPDYLARLNRGIQKSWMQVLARHDANPWPPIPAWSVPLRQAKAWFYHRAWSSPAARIRWQGACGHFDGRVDVPSAASPPRCYMNPDTRS